MINFEHILKWKLLRGSHTFPGPDGGTCINEAAVVVCGYDYRPIGSVHAMPACFSRPICRLAMELNDNATNAQRQRLLPFVMRLACADTPEVEFERTHYINKHFGTRPHPDFCGFDRGLRVLEGALGIGRQADTLTIEEIARRLDAVRTSVQPGKSRSISLSAKIKAWLHIQGELESAE